MKSNFSSIILGLACVVIMAGCGGGSGSGVKVKKNQYLGELPVIYADYNAKREAHKAKVEEQEKKLMKSGKADFGKIMKLKAEDKEKSEALKEKFKTDLTNEMSKVIGNDIPVTVSEGLTASDKVFYDVSAKIIEKYGTAFIAVYFKAKNETVIPRRNTSNYDISWLLVTSDGSPITTYCGYMNLFNWSSKDITIAAGEQFKEEQVSFSEISHKPEKFSDFAGIKIMTKGECDEMLKAQQEKEAAQQEQERSKKK